LKETISPELGVPEVKNTVVPGDAVNL